MSVSTTRTPSGVTRGWAGWALCPPRSLLGGNVGKIGGNKRGKERGRKKRERKEKGREKGKRKEERKRGKVGKGERRHEKKKEIR